MCDFTAPGVVEIVNINIISSSAAAVVWNPPTEPNGIITGYEVVYGIHETPSPTIAVLFASDINSFNITDLGKVH